MNYLEIIKNNLFEPILLYRTKGILFKIAYIHYDYSNLSNYKIKKLRKSKSPEFLSKLEESIHETYNANHYKKA